ncbi:MAG TPA: Ppx/GppA family phosphatase [Thiotrichales bacterium]|nr:Ppx/GppA family phosphatase [Thiotrichales bacterium]
MIVARLEETGTLSIIDRLRESVRLGGGLTKKGKLKKAAQQRAFRCLETFSQRVRDLPDSAVRIAGTNTLRVATNAREFVQQAEAILQHPIEIIAGREEARLIYLGVAHGLAAGEGKRLVVDIGGGSTEFIIGQGMNPLRRESLFTGCVSASKKFFGDGISKQAMQAAQIDASLTLLPQAARFRAGKWDEAIGCAGTIRAIRNILHEEGWCNSGIEREALYKLRKVVIKAGHEDKLELKGLSESRRPVLAGGLSVLIAVFNTLEIDHMKVSDQSMREGLLYDLVGRINHQDVRDATVETIMLRWAVDTEQAERVTTTVEQLCRQACPQWGIDDEPFQYLVRWAARLHEIGLAVSHSHYHKHGAYLLSNADMQGFSRQEQALLANLVMNHRGKFRAGEFDQLMKPFVKPGKQLCILLRLAVLIHRGRSDATTPEIKLKVNKKHVHLGFPPGWLDDHSLTLADLGKEVAYLRKAGYKLSYE